VGSISFLSLDERSVQTFYMGLIIITVIYVALMTRHVGGTSQAPQLFLQTWEVPFGVSRGPVALSRTGGDGQNASIVFADMDHDGSVDDGEWLYMVAGGSTLSRTVVHDGGHLTVLSATDRSAVLSSFPRCAYPGTPLSFRYIIRNPGPSELVYDAVVGLNASVLERSTYTIDARASLTVTSTFRAPEITGWYQLDVSVRSRDAYVDDIISFWMRVSPEHDRSCMIDLRLGGVAR
jgi:hypothetical protein